MKEYNIFYSWQSDDKHTRNVIKSKIKDACDKLLDEENIIVNIIEDSRTENGAEHIDTGLLKSIDNCDLFIADVTPVSQYESDGEVKLSPNGNVLFETGYAVGKIGHNRCKLIARLEEGHNFNKLPFDINHRKILTFTNDNRASLQFIKNWILEKIPLIDSIRAEMVPFENAEICFINTSDSQNNFVSELTLQPVFKRTQYVQLTERIETSSTKHDYINDVIFGKTYAINAMIDQYRQKIGIPIVHPNIVKPISREINESLVPLQLIINNNGQTQLRDLRIQIWCVDNVRFFDTPVNERFQMPIIRNSSDLWIYEDGKHMGMEISKLNSTEVVTLGEIYIQLPFEKSVVHIHWAFTSSTINREGILTIYSGPIYNDEYKESRDRAGEIDYSPIIRTE